MLAQISDEASELGGGPVTEAKVAAVKTEIVDSTGGDKKAEPAADATNEKSKTGEAEKPSPEEPNSANATPEPKKDLVTKEAVKKTKDEKDSSEKMASDDKKVADA